MKERETGESSRRKEGLRPSGRVGSICWVWPKSSGGPRRERRESRDRIPRSAPRQRD